MIKGHQTDNDVAPPRQEFADEIQAGEYGGKKRKGDDDVEGAEREVSIGREKDHDP